MKRVMVVGGPGSGKSTFARALGARTGLPVFHMDLIHWLPGWVERPHDTKSHMTEEVHARDLWIFEGGHSATYPQRIARADTLIWLDLPLALRLWRVLKRWAQYRGQSRPDLPENCPEQLNLAFYWFIVRTSKKQRRRHMAILTDTPPHLTCHHLHNRAKVAEFLTHV